MLRFTRDRAIASIELVLLPRKIICFEMFPTMLKKKVNF